MAYDANFDLTDLSARNRRIFAAGVRGGDGSTEGEGTPPDPAETTPAAEAPEGAEAQGQEEAPPEGTVVPEVPEDLTAVEVEALQSLHGELGTAREAIRENARTQTDLDQIQAITAARRAIAAELQRRIDESARIREGLSALDEELAAEPALPEPELSLASATPARPSAAQIAAARGTQARAAQEPPVSRPNRPRAALLSSVSTDTMPVGQEMDAADLGHALDRSKRGTGRSVVASIQPFAETEGMPELLSSDNGAEKNTALMREAQESWRARERGDDARVAAICEPFDILRTIPDNFGTSEPVRDIFPARPAGRLGLQFIPSVGLSAVAGSTALWNEDDQAAVDVDDPDTWKVCLDIDCPTAQTIAAEAIVSCLTYDLTTEMSNPEHIGNLMNALNALRARTKEGKILQRVDLLSHKYTFEAVYGAMPTLIRALNTAMAQANYTDRQNEPGYTVILPPGLVALLAIDMAGRAYNSDTVRDVLTYLRDNVDGVGRVVASLDASLSGEPGLPFAALNPVGNAAVPLPGLDGTHRVRLVDPSAALYAETGALNVGTTRDSQLLRANKTQYFAEEFLFLAKNGPQPWFRLDIDFCADGSRAGLLEPVGCTS